MAYLPVEITMISTTERVLPGTIKSPQSVLLTLDYQYLNTIYQQRIIKSGGGFDLLGYFITK